MKIYRSLVVIVIGSSNGKSIVSDSSGAVHEVDDKDLIPYPQAELVSCVVKDMSCQSCPHYKEGRCTR